MTQQPNWNLADIVRRGAREHPDRIAIRYGDSCTTYRQLEERTAEVARGLLGWQVARQSRVAFLDFNSTAYLEALFAAVKADCVLVGINARLAAQEVLYILNDAAAAVLFVGREHYALVESIEPGLATVKHIVALDGEHPRWPDYREWRDSQDRSGPLLEASEDSDAIQLYTSGTTGHAKGVCHTHRGWREFSRAVKAASWADYDASTVTFVCMPLFHVAGFNLSCLTLLAGGCVVLARRFEPRDILDFIPRYGITDALLVPAMIHELVVHPRAASTNFSSLRHVSYGAAPIANELLVRAQKLFGCGFVHLYGLTENLGGATFLPPDMHRAELGKQKSCGRAYAGLQLKIVDANGHRVPIGTTGEILVQSAWTMRSYWRNDEATHQTIRDGWLHTGDAGYVDADGYVYIQDRVKDMIVSGGENVYPAEVENALFDHPAIAEVAVIGVPDAKWGEAVKAIVVLKPGASLNVDDVLNHARARVAGYKLPKSIDVVTALPRNASGKVLRRQLREPYWRGQERQVG